MARWVVWAVVIAASGATVTLAAEVEITAGSDIVNGDVSSMVALLARPGPDGISIREALEASGPPSVTTGPGSHTRPRRSSIDR